MKRLVMLAACVFLWTTSARPQELSNVGAAFVDVGIGARAVGLGGAYAAFARSADAVFWNPAGLALMHGRAVEFSRVNQFGLVPYNAFAGGMNFGGNQAIGFGLLASGDEQLRETTVLLGYAFSGEELLPGFLGNLRLGVNVKYQSASYGKNGFNAADFPLFSDEQIAEGERAFVSGAASGYGVDFGLLYSFNAGVQVAVTWQNAVSRLTWENGESAYAESIPGRFTLGAAFQTHRGLIVTTQYENVPSNTGSNRLRFGTEKIVLQSFRLRAGVGHTLTANSSRDYALGMGLYQAIPGFGTLRFDYAYQLHPIENMHRFSLGFAF